MSRIKIASRLSLISAALAPSRDKVEVFFGVENNPVFALGAVVEYRESLRLSFYWFPSDHRTTFSAAAFSFSVYSFSPSHEC